MPKFFAPALALGIVATALTAGASTADAAPGFKRCSDAVAAGVAPMYAWEPTYQKNLDRNNNGIACETDLPAGYKPHVPAPKPSTTKPAPTKSAPTTKPAPKPTKPAPVGQVPVTPAKPGTPEPTEPGTGPVVQTDRVNSTGDAAGAYGMLALVGAAAGAGALRIRALKR